VVEVLVEPDAEHVGQADRHVGVAREVEVDLERVAGHGQPREPGVQLGRRDAQDRVGHGGELVGDQQLLRQAAEEATDPVGELVDGERPRLHRPDDVGVADDGPGDQVGEEHDVERQVERVPLVPDRPAIDVAQIRDRVEGQERDPQRQRDQAQLDRRHPEPSQDRAEVVDEEVAVFEVDQEKEIRRDPRPEQELLEALASHAPDHQAEGVVRRDRRDHEEYERAFAPAVEQEARGQEPCVPELRPQDAMHQHHGRQEQEEERGLGE
jgi:hypothetical protein